MQKTPLSALLAAGLVLAGCQGKPTLDDDTGTVGADTGSSDDGGDGGTTETGEDLASWTFAIEGPTTAAPNQTVPYAGVLLDGDGEDRTDEAGLELSLDGAAQDGLEVTPTKTGELGVSLTATLGEESWTDELTLTVAVGEPYAIDLVLEADNAELGEGLGWEATVTDAWGNVTEDGLTISADVASGWSVDGDEIVFSDEGSFVFTATAGSKSPVSDTEGPVTVDSNGPLILLDEPGRGAFVEGTSVTVSGTVEDPTTGLASFTVAGEEVEVGEDGSFSVEIELDEGPNTVLVEAADADGNSSDLSFAALAGAFQEVDAANDNGLLVRLNQQALDSVVEPLSDELDAEAVEDALIAANPLASGSEGACDWEADATAVDFTVAAPTTSPASGELELELVLEDLQIDLDIPYTCGNVTLTDTGEVSDTVTRISAIVEIAALGDGEVEVSVSEVAVAFTDLRVESGAFGDFNAEDFEEAFAAAIATIIEDKLPEALEEALEAVTVGQEITVQGATTSLVAVIGGVELDADGLTLALATTVTADDADAPGYWIQEGAEPDFPDTPGLLLGIELDVLGAIFHGVWAGGGFDMELSHTELGLDASMITLVFEGAKSLDLVLDAAHPPVFSADTAGDLYLRMGGLLVDFYGDIDGKYTHLGTAVMHATVPTEVSLGSDTIALTFGTAEAEVDVLVEDAYQVGDAETLQALLEAVLATFGSELFPAVGLEVPDLGAYGLAADDVYLDGDDTSWITLEGDLK